MEEKVSNSKFLAIIPLMVLILFETVSRGSLADTLVWSVHYPNQFVATYAMLFGLINAFYLLPRRLYLSIAAVILTGLSFIALVSREKLLLRGEPLLPWDLNLGKEAANISQSFQDLPIAFMLGLVILLIAALILIICYIPREKYLSAQKVPIAVLSFLLLFNLVAHTSMQKTFNCRLVNWSQQSNYEENGLIIGFMMNYKAYSDDAPATYQKEEIEKIIAQTKTDYTVDPDFTPNVIFVQSEAFWDPTLMKEVSFSEDPIPYFHYLQKNYSGGKMVVPVFAGGTVNTEFEVLTGYSCQFLPAGIIPYVQYATRDMDALPAVYKKQGYEATAIHTYHNWFYRRNIVFEEMGFGKFISKEFFADPECKGTYIRDTELTKKILQQLGQNDKPDFIYAISMQAHGPYAEKPNAGNTIQVQGNFSAKSKTLLENYVNTISDVDQSLKALIEGLKKIDEPTIVVFYGDHLPLLGNSSEVYKEADFFQDRNNYSDYLNKYTVPFIVWDNFSSPKDKENIRISSSFLGPYILEKSKKEGNTLTDFLYSLYEKGSDVMTAALYQQNEKITETESADYEMLQYDSLIGNAYAYELEPRDKPVQNALYLLGERFPKIEKVLRLSEDVIQVQGENFLPDYQIYIDDTPVKTKYVSNTVLTATLPKSIQNETEPVKLLLKMIDSLNNVISESNTYSFSRADGASVDAK
ncbi:hypothetical protein UNSWDHB_2028 [Dehalobacter sp. UNSWDHB]|jgi:Phosphoglycerol transferase and related proteins, alkaline phosphatase superfamily|nr:Cyclic beta-1,2-glucan modification transmembrane protein [Dehalobacter sp. DCA]AFV04874.1 Cyclic beta-1,2-glucan modification transmembrane protein [Dehalobacter sp. CF]EQB20699.1 hypothetical protein UNSWDHB_2028 [Dehalobacter sp. UNSWDHB]